MALRLTDPVPTPAADAAPAADHRAQTHHLVARATGCLQIRDVAGYRALFAETATMDDVHARWRARIALIETGLQAKGRGVNQIGPVFAAVAAAAIELLEDEPREPMLLNYAGIALYEVGAVVPAEKLFAAAQRLDPHLPHVSGNIDACRKRRRAGATAIPGLAPDVVRLLRELDGRAKRVAARAKPAEGLRLSLCMIVKDEEAMLGRCLEAVRDAVDEIVIVDTGSTDRTVEIAESFGARILHHAWTGDFAAARNVSFDAATGDWVMYLDADEVLVAEDVEKLRSIKGRVWREAFYLVETNHTGQIEDGTAVTHNALRVFRNRPHVRFEGRIHEQIAHTLPALPERLEHTGIRIDHYGYLGKVRSEKEKSRRNIELLERQIAEGMDTPFVAFNLGSEYAALGEAETAHKHFRKAWEALKGDRGILSYGYVPSLAGRYVTSLRVTERFDEAIRQADEVLELFPGFTDVVLEKAYVMREQGRREEARALVERCLEMGDAPPRYSATVGCGSYIALTVLGGLQADEGDFAGAEATLRRCLEDHPRFLGAVEPLAQAMLRRGAAPADVVTEIHDLAEEVTPSLRFVLAVQLHEAGAAAEAEAELRGVLAAQPGADAARVALAETLLSQGRLEDAAAEAALVAPDSLWAPAAARSELFALLAAGTGDERVVAALERAREGGLDGAEIALFAAWSDAVAGRALPEALPAAGIEPATTMLEALARIEAFEAFETLVAAYERIALPWRELRERLARVYLRRGFVDSAAEEWLLVCERTGPDAAALAGLAEVAAARGLEEDARTLASEAQRLAVAA